MTMIGRQQRPGVVTFVGIVLYISAAISAVTALVAFLNRNDADFAANAGVSSDALLATAAIEGALALLLFLVAGGVMSGMRLSRMLVAFVYGARMCVAVYWMLTHHGGGFGSGGLLTVGIGIFVLWALYGHAESARYFNKLPALRE
jgi:hypothetical protein